MSTQVTLTLPDEVYRRAERLAQLSSREVADVLADTIELSLSPVGLKSEAVEPVSGLSDEEVMALAELQLASDQDQRLSSLLDKQQAGTLIEAERSELLALMQVYQESLLRKAQALREAVQRGLRKPLDP
jgi:predicted DNA-binding protein